MKRKDFFKSLLALPFIPSMLSAKPVNIISSKERKIWTIDDIEAGRWIIRASAFTKNTSVTYAATVTKQIGYIFAPRVVGKYCYNSLCDGWVYDNRSQLMTKQQVVDDLNKDSIGWRYVSLDEMNQMQAVLTKNFKG